MHWLSHSFIQNGYLASLQMKFFKRAVGRTHFGNKRDEEILEDVKVEPVDEKQRRYSSFGT